MKKLPINKRFVFDKVNTILFVFGLLLLVIGYAAIAAGDRTLSPIILVIAYIIVFPAAILWGALKKRKDNSENKG